MSKEPIWDTVVIGAGPAGLAAAIMIARRQKKVLILESGPRPGRKLLITGGGHCNISNRCVTENDFQSGQPRTVRNILRAFPIEKVSRFFKELGVGIVEEEGGKLFPETHSAETVLQSLLAEAGKRSIRLETLRKVTHVGYRDGRFVTSGAGFDYESRTVILATGGLSYPETGSDGSGYAFARAFGHTIVPTTPALVALDLNDPAWNSLAGIALPVELLLDRNGKKIARAVGPLLFTHTGLSGPAVLDLSRHWIRLEDRRAVTICVNFLPRYKAEEFFDEIATAAVQQPALSLKNALARYFPERLAEALVRKSGLDPVSQMAHCSKKDRLALCRTVFSAMIEVSGASGYEKAEVTAGGVDMNEVDPRTLESKLQSGLFFVGEILDVDGRIGGFNLHWAWASGHAAGEAASKKSAEFTPLEF